MLVKGNAAQPPLRLEYDPEVDALLVQYAPEGKSVRTIDRGDGVYEDRDERGRLVSVEVLDASRKYSREQLQVFGKPGSGMTLLQAARRIGIAASTLRVQINRGRIKASKQGRDWIVSKAALDAYQAGKAPSGRRAVGRRSARGGAARKGAKGKRGFRKRA